MPSQETRTERYWTWCWKRFWGINIPYPCRKTRTITVWCYRFSSVKDDCKIFWETHYGCESGQEYKWSDGCFGWFNAYRSNVYKCFKRSLNDQGSCTEGGSIPIGGQWPPSYNPTRRGALVAGGSSTIIAGLLIFFTQIATIQYHLTESGPITQWSIELIACLGIPIILVILAIISSVFIFRQRGRMGRGSIIGGLLAIITAILLFLSSYSCVQITTQTLIGIILLVIGGILSLIGE